MVSQSEFKKAAKKIGIGRFRGRYSGRYYHEGVAVDFDSIAELGAFVGKLATMPRLADLAAIQPHTDDMGRGIVASWDVSLFEE